MRLGWYGGRGAREVKLVTGQAASPQPYPVADGKFGIAEAKWADSVSIATDASWTPGLYVARVESSAGKDAVTFFTVRDDGMDKLPILLVVGLTTHETYNSWPVHPTESIKDLTQAVRVSLDRPFFVGGAIADVGG